MKGASPPFAFILSWLTLNNAAVAAGLPLRDLFGHSLVADWSITETETCSACRAKKQPYEALKHFTEKIYVSNQGRLFHNRNTVVNGAQRNNFSLITTNTTQELVYDPAAGFISRVIPSDYNAGETTFVRLTIISIKTNGNDLECAVSSKLVMKNGQKEFIFYSDGPRHDERSEYQIHSFNMSQSSCVVSPGNIFAN